MARKGRIYKYKVGDRVTVNDNYPNISGSTGTLISMYTYYKVRLDETKIDYYLTEDEIDLIVPKTVMERIEEITF